MEEIANYKFHPNDLRLDQRKPGVSGLLRTRNGGAFLEACVRSHIDALDELVIIFNQCTDDTAQIVAKLEAEFPSKIKAFHYLPRVQPLGSEGHAQSNFDDLDNLANYSNAGLVQTSRQYMMKVDDDHLAIPGVLAGLAERARSGELNDRTLYALSGLNIARAGGALGIPAQVPVPGLGDYGLQKLGPQSYFTADHRFERFRPPGQRRVFAGFQYWHLKFLKPDAFANYELSDNPDSRYHAQKQRAETTSLLSLPAWLGSLSTGPSAQLKALVYDKHRIALDRARQAKQLFAGLALEQALGQMGASELAGLEADARKRFQETNS